MTLPDFSTRKNEMMALLREMVETESPSHDKAAVDKVGKIVAERCRQLGAQVEIVPGEKTGDHIIARWGTEYEGKSILTLHHMDTVFPIGTLAKMPFYEKDGKVYGPGVVDMKGGGVVTLTAIAGLIEAGLMPKCPVVALFTSDEEIGSDSSRALIEKLALEAKVVFVLEAGMPDGSAKVWRKGVGEYFIKVKGRASHAGGAHAEGRNAIAEMAHHISAIQALTDYDKGTTANVGVIKGGIASNVVPDECSIEVDYRVLDPKESDRVDAVIRSLKPVIEGTSIEIHGGLNRPPMPNDATMQATFARAKAIAATIGIDLTASGTGGGSDANFVAPLGIPVLDGLGPVGEGYHSEREFFLTDTFISRTKLLAALISQW